MINIVGKNGAGKSFISNRLLELGYSKPINYTTRPIRHNEINGIDYYFVSKDEFKKLILNDFFADYKEYNGNFYGVPKIEIENKTLMISGNLDKFKMTSFGKIIPFYINAPMEVRYKRVLERNINDIFERFHGENFMYLQNFEGCFISNEKDDDTAINKIISMIDINGNLVETKPQQNLYFISKEITKFNFSNFYICEDKILNFLRYEEYILRMIRCLPSFKLLSIEEIKKYYFACIIAFLDEYGYTYSFNSYGIYIKIDDKNYFADFKKDYIKNLKMEV